MMTKHHVLRLFCMTTILIPAAARADWPNFRGPNHDGISTETTFKKAHDGGLKPLWEREVGSAFSSFAVVGNRVYTCGLADDKETLISLDAEKGDVIWQIPIESAYRESHGDGARATPTVNDGRVYILGANGRLLCVDAETGKEIWDRKFKNKPTWAYSGSVLIEGDMAIVSPGSGDGALLALDKVSGKEIWHCGEDAAGYATPYPFTFNGKRYVIGFMAKAAIIAEVNTGKLVWRMPWETSWDVNAASPIVDGDKLFITSGYETGCGLYKLSADGDELKTTKIWKSTVLLNKFQSCVLYEGYLYVSDQQNFKCVEFATGKRMWRERAKSSPLMLADGNIIMLTEDGTLQIGKASPKGFEPTTKATVLSGLCWSVPVLNDGRLYVRNLETVKCFDLR